MPGKEKPVSVDQWNIKANIGVTQYTGWLFEKKNELVSGKWTIEIIDNDIPLASKTFDVIAGS